MSKVNPPVCPLMSRSIHIPDSATPDIDDYGAEDQDYLIKAYCLMEKCAWWFHNEEMCSLRMLACATYDEPIGGN